MLVCSDWASLSQPDHLEGPEGGQPCHRLELKPDDEGPEGGRPAPAHHHPKAQVRSRDITDVTCACVHVHVHVACDPMLLELSPRPLKM